MVIDQLPDLVLFELFSFLSWEEKLRLKAVCRRLNFLLTSLFTEIPRLFVHRKVMSLRETWQSPDQPVQCQEYIHLKLFLRLLRVGYFRSVKSLHLFKLSVNYGDPRPIFEEASRELLFSCLAKLDELFVTEEDRIINLFDTDEFSLEKGDTKRVDLPDLKSVSIRYSLGYRSKVLKINSERLERLVFLADAEQRIVLSHPEEIRYIECLHFTEKVFQWKRFPNLEHLNCLNVDTNFDLSQYPKLRKFDLCPSKEQFENGLHIVKRLFEQKESLGRSDLEITLFGFNELTPVALERKNESNEYTQLKLEELSELKNNFSSFVGPLPWPINILITPAVDGNLGSLPRFICRFIQRLNINRVILTGNPNPAMVIRFLKGINGVRSLWISKCSYSNKFYDQLDSVPYIHCLAFCDSQMSTVTSYDFITTLRFLKEIHVKDSFPSLEDLGKVIERCDVEHFVLLHNVFKSGKSVFFEAKIHSDKPFEVRFRHYGRYFETWEEAVVFVRKCEHINRRPMLKRRIVKTRDGSRVRQFYPFVNIEKELRALDSEIPICHLKLQ